MFVKPNANALILERREVVNNLTSNETLADAENVEATALTEAPQTAETPTNAELDNSKNLQTEAAEASALEPVFSIEDVKLAFFYAEKELIEVCVEAYTNKNFKLPLSYAPEDISAEKLEFCKQEMVN
jgi:hypothetical protein